jgi:cytochrome bd-type quinol oxidase subunit 1
MDALVLHRIHFGFTITYHYLFPQLTMGLALLIVVLKTVALLKHSEAYNKAARFWAKIFAVNFLIGVVTGIPMEFQFGTNWAQFSRTTGGVIGQPLAMEGVFSFFLNRRSWDCSCLVKNGCRRGDTGPRRLWSSSVHGSQDFSSSLPMPGCSIR